MSRLVRLGLALVLGASTAACAALLGFERLEEERATKAEAGADAEAGAPTEEAGSSVCEQPGYPARPPLDDAGAGAEVPVLVAMNAFGFGEESDPPGFNLDRACTTSPQSGTCRAAVVDDRFAQYVVDRDDRGKDNAGLGLIAYLSTLSSAFRPSEISARLARAEYGLVVRVSQWSGAAEDRSVFVELFPAIGRARGDAGAFAPTDRWRLDTRHTLTADPKIAPTSKINAVGWVTGSTLVVPFSSLTLSVSIPDDDKPFDLVVTDAVVRASLVQDEGGRRRLADVVVAGRWSTAALLAQVRTIYLKDAVGFKNTYLCEPPGSAVYDLVKTRLCEGRDIRAATADDRKELPCDAVSVAVRLDTYALDEVGEYGTRAVTPRCVPDAGRTVTVPEGDDCAAIP